jgi:hypothetical protein
MLSWLLGKPIAEDEKVQRDCTESCKSCAGTVTPHDFHVLVRLQHDYDSSSDVEYWWPEKVDGEEAIQLVSACSVHGKKLKVTAFEYPKSDQRFTRYQYEAYVFPGNFHIVSDSHEKVAHLVQQVLQVCSGALEDVDSSVTKLSDEMIFIVCCHANRDSRCGKKGPEIAEELLCEGQCVLLSSHVGGHVYAGNVTVNKPGHPSDGSWFGGIDRSRVKRLLDGIHESGKKAADPVKVAALRPLWRGKIGMTKEQQLEMFKENDIEDII